MSPDPWEHPPAGGAIPDPYIPWTPTPPPSGWAQSVPPPSWTPPPPPPESRPPRRRRALVALIVGAALMAGVGIGIPIGLITRGSHPGPPAPIVRPGPTVGPAAVEARRLYQQALAATGASTGFHYVSVSTGGTDNQKIVGDAGQKGGGQLITIDSTFGHEQFTLVLVGATVYFQGNVPALQDQLGVPAAGAAAVDGKWIAVSSGDGPYSVVAPGIVVADQVQEMALIPTSSSQVTTGDGTKVIRINGTLPPGQGGSGSAGTAHLDIAVDTHLPITQVTTVRVRGMSLTDTTTYSAWGTAPTQTAPSGAVAWSTLGASEPPGGYGNGGATPGASPGASASPAV